MDVWPGLDALGSKGLTQRKQLCFDCPVIGHVPCCRFQRGTSGWRGITRTTQQTQELTAQCLTPFSGVGSFSRYICDPILYICDPILYICDPIFYNICDPIFYNICDPIFYICDPIFYSCNPLFYICDPILCITLFYAHFGFALHDLSWYRECRPLSSVNMFVLK